MAEFKDLINIVSIMNKASYNKQVSHLLSILNHMEANPAAKDKLKNDNWLAENVLYVLFILYCARELMTNPKIQLLIQFCSELRPDDISLTGFMLKEFTQTTPTLKKQFMPRKK